MEPETYCPTNQADWRAWLAEHHACKDSIWLIIHKKNSPNQNLTWSQAVDEALCFGWIDSTARPIDTEKYKQYFTRRKPKSNWSKVNKDKVANLIASGLMQEAGQRSIDIAKENGSWTSLDAVEALEVPKDLEDKLKAIPEALAFFEAQSKSTMKGLLYWVYSAKREETRAKRIAEIVENARHNQMPKQLK
jgi:uncharacterized protein YdeI (YjbR/CyaY-like superfamily)